MRWFTGHLRRSHRVPNLTPDTWPYDAAAYGRLGLGAQPARDRTRRGTPLHVPRSPRGYGSGSIARSESLTLVPPGGEASLAEGQSSILPSPPPSGLGSGAVGLRLPLPWWGEGEDLVMLAERLSSPPRLRGWVWVTCANPPTQWVREAMWDTSAPAGHMGCSGGGGSGGPRLSLYPGRGAGGVQKHRGVHVCAHALIGQFHSSRRAGGRRPVRRCAAALLCSRGALRACGGAGFACACLAALTRTCWLSRSRACAAACGSVLSVVPLIVQCGAMWCCCGLCSASRACAVVKP